MLIDLQPPSGYDAVVILTDGQLNRGIVTEPGLLTLIQGLRTVVPVTGLGYGADHNRILLRNLALKTRGSYTYVDTDETLPVVMGDFIGGLRDVRSMDGTVSVSDGWSCMELCAESPYRVGAMVGDRDYWVVFTRTDARTDAPTVTFNAGGQSVTVTASPGDITEQVMRARVAKALYDTSNSAEGHHSATVLDGLNALKGELEAIVPKTSLYLRMLAQVNDAISVISSPPRTWGMTAAIRTGGQLSAGGTGAAGGGGFHRYGLGGGLHVSTNSATPDALARLASSTAYYSTQRGVADDGSQMFSSPCQRIASTQCRTVYDDLDDPASLSSQRSQ
jgi:hypothetical protein